MLLTMNYEEINQSLDKLFKELQNLTTELTNKVADDGSETNGNVMTEISKEFCYIELQAIGKYALETCIRLMSYDNRIKK